MAAHTITATDIFTLFGNYTLYLENGRIIGFRNNAEGVISWIRLARENGTRFEIPVAPGQEFDVEIV